MQKHKMKGMAKGAIKSAEAKVESKAKAMDMKNAAKKKGK